MKRLVFVLTLCLAALTAMPQHHSSHRGSHPSRTEIHHGDHRGHDYNCARHDQMRMVKQTLHKQSFDDDKLEIACLCVTLGEFCTLDLADMAAEFSFDDNRTKFLKYAYDYCTDPQNYYFLRDSFTFKSNFDDMMSTIQPPLRR